MINSLSSGAGFLKSTVSPYASRMPVRWVQISVFLTAFQVENDTAGAGNGSEDSPEISREVTLGSYEDSGETYSSKIYFMT